MNMATLRQLAGQGVEIGSHTLTHPRLAALPVTAQRREIADSKKKLEDSLGQAVLHFCYPYGSFTEETIMLVREAGYQTALTCERKRVSLQDDLFRLPRKAISCGDNAAGFLWKLYVKHD
jgi:peptidoglycan/xylan/chitin deacetylase (PgdA/CDA1 family)